MQMPQEPPFGADLSKPPEYVGGPRQPAGCMSARTPPSPGRSQARNRSGGLARRCSRRCHSGSPTGAPTPRCSATRTSSARCCRPSPCTPATSRRRSEGWTGYRRTAPRCWSGTIRVCSTCPRHGPAGRPSWPAAASTRRVGRLQHGDQPGGRWLPAALGCNRAAPLRARSRSVRGRQDPVQELHLHAAVALSGSLSGAAGRGGPGDRAAAPAHLPGAGAAPGRRPVQAPATASPPGPGRCPA